MTIDQSIRDLRIETAEFHVLRNPVSPPFRSGSVTLDAIYDVFAVVGADGETGRGYGSAFSREHSDLLVTTARSLTGLVLERQVADWEVHHDLAPRIRLGDDIGVAPISEHALGITEIALLDLVGRLTSRPAHQVLGHSPTPVRYYPSGGSLADTVDRLGDFFEAASAAGASLVKIKIDGSDPASAASRARGSAARLPEGMTLAVDANQTFTHYSACVFADAVGDLDPPLAWLEEPLPAHQIDALVDIRTETGIRIAAGETLYGEAAPHRLLEAGAIDRLQLSIARHGGVAAFRRLGDAARDHGVSIASHVNTQLSAQAVDPTWLDPVVEYIPWWDAHFVPGAYRFADGRIHVNPKTRGFGFHHQEMRQ